MVDLNHDDDPSQPEESRYSPPGRAVTVADSAGQILPSIVRGYASRAVHRVPAIDSFLRKGREARQVEKERKARRESEKSRFITVALDDREQYLRFTEAAFLQFHGNGIELTNAPVANTVRV